MTTIVCTTAEGADSIDESGALDPFQGLKQLLPKLTHPSWVRLIGEQLVPLKHAALSPEVKTAVERAKRRNSRRLARALRGEFTRVRHATA